MAADVVKTVVIAGDGAAKVDPYVKLSVVVKGCVRMSVDGGVCIHGRKDSTILDSQWRVAKGAVLRPPTFQGQVSVTPSDYLDY